MSLRNRLLELLEIGGALSAFFAGTTEYVRETSVTTMIQDMEQKLYNSIVGKLDIGKDSNWPGLRILAFYDRFSINYADNSVIDKAYAYDANVYTSRDLTGTLDKVLHQVSQDFINGQTPMAVIHDKSPALMNNVLNYGSSMNEVSVALLGSGVGDLDIATVRNLDSYSSGHFFGEIHSLDYYLYGATALGLLSATLLGLRAFYFYKNRHAIKEIATDLKNGAVNFFRNKVFDREQLNGIKQAGNFFNSLYG